MLWETNEFALLLAFLAAFLIALEAGYRLGRRRSTRSDDKDLAHTNSLQAAALGLLALLLSFTFFMAVSRYDTRKALVLEEANAIGTTFLRADFLPPGQRKASQALLREHVSARLAYYSVGINAAGLEKAAIESARIEAALWALAVDAAAQDPRSLPTRLFIESLNGVIDVDEKRRVALDNHVPEAVIHLLLAVSIASLGLLGYGSGLTKRRNFASNALIALLIALVVITILDTDRPRRGLIEVTQDSLVRLKATMAHERP